MIGWKLHNEGELLPGAVVMPRERLGWGRTIGLGAQHVVAVFGATFVGVATAIYRIGRGSPTSGSEGAPRPGDSRNGRRGTACPGVGVPVRLGRAFYPGYKWVCPLAWRDVVSWRGKQEIRLNND